MDGRRDDRAEAAGAPPSEEEEGLPILSIVGSVVAGRLRDPRVLAATLAAAVLVGFALGRLTGRRR